MDGENTGGAAPAPRLYHPAPFSPGAVLTLPDAAARHVQALRLEPGDAVVLFCGDGAESRAEIVDIQRRATVVRLTGQRHIDRESPLRIVLAQGICAGDRMDWVIQKATELGVAAVQPLVTERTVVRLGGERRERREQHWQNVAIAACEQCGRNRIPAVEPTLTLEQFMAALGPVPDTSLRILLSPYAQRRVADLHQSSSTMLAVGPEGGFSESERSLLERYGFIPVRLGPRILRTETAPLAALTLLQSLWGDL